jgi:hypothetical protein
MQRHACHYELARCMFSFTRLDVSKEVYLASYHMAPLTCQDWMHKRTSTRRALKRLATESTEYTGI